MMLVGDESQLSYGEDLCVRTMSALSRQLLYGGNLRVDWVIIECYEHLYVCTYANCTIKLKYTSFL